MADLTHETADDAFHEIQLSGKQLVFLFMATTVISVIIFICGVLVGRSVPIEGISAAEAPSATGRAPVEAPVPAEGATTPPPSTAQVAEGTSYSDRLSAQSSAPEKLTPVTEPPPAPVAAEAPRPVPETAAATPPARETAEPVRQAPAQAGTWAVQVVSLRDRGAANQIVQRLQGRNYPAFLVAPSPGAPTQLYKVQVGKYKDRAEAERIQARLKKEEQFDPWIVR